MKGDRLHQRISFIQLQTALNQHTSSKQDYKELDAELKTGDRVRLAIAPPYFKTAEPIPMLRPADRVQIGEEGVILGRAPGGVWQVRFENGAYLLDQQYIELTSEELD